MRIGTAEIHRQVEQLDEVLDSVVVGQDWQNDVRVVLFVRLREGLALDEALRERIRRQIRANTTPRHVPARIVQVPEIPRTISGKVVELAWETITGRRQEYGCARESARSSTPPTGRSSRLTARQTSASQPIEAAPPARPRPDEPQRQVVLRLEDLRRRGSRDGRVRSAGGG